MQRALPVILIGVAMALVTGVGVWWVHGNRKLWEKRDFKRLQARRRQALRAAGLLLALVLGLGSLGAALYVAASGGVLAR